VYAFVKAILGEYAPQRPEKFPQVALNGTATETVMAHEPTREYG